MRRPPDAGSGPCRPPAAAPVRTCRTGSSASSSGGGRAADQGRADTGALSLQGRPGTPSTSRPRSPGPPGSPPRRLGADCRGAPGPARPAGPAHRPAPRGPCCCSVIARAIGVLTAQPGSAVTAFAVRRAPSRPLVAARPGHCYQHPYPRGRCGRRLRALHQDRPEPGSIGCGRPPGPVHRVSGAQLVDQPLPGAALQQLTTSAGR